MRRLQIEFQRCKKLKSKQDIHSPPVADGFAEIHRTLKPGGSVAITSWAPVDQSPAMQTMFGLAMMGGRSRREKW